MKTFFLILLILFICLKSSSQCPQPGLKIQSASCNGASDLEASIISCSEVKLKWRGSEGQAYVIKTTGSNAPNTNFEAAISNYTCDGNGFCEATIAVNENSTINWSVQSTCTENGGTLYGSVTNGKQIIVPVCTHQNNATNENSIKAYPNPSTGRLTVEYNGSVTPNTVFAIYNSSGKQVYVVKGSAVKQVNSGYQFDLHHLANGSYFLKLQNGADIKQVKFILIKE